MGSPISFPVLCMANLIICRWTLENIAGKRLSLGHLPMLINGDDVLFHLSDDMRASGQYTLWKWATQQVGLKFSLGKNYISKKYLVINSELWKVHETTNFFGMKEWNIDSFIRTINLGLLKTEKKSASSLESEQSHLGTHLMQNDSLRARATLFCEAHAPEKRDAALSLWIKENQEQMNVLLPRGMSYFVHPSLGEIGRASCRERV